MHVAAGESLGIEGIRQRMSRFVVDVNDHELWHPRARTTSRWRLRLRLMLPSRWRPCLGVVLRQWRKLQESTQCQSHASPTLFRMPSIDDVRGILNGSVRPALVQARRRVEPCGAFSVRKRWWADSPSSGCRAGRGGLPSAVRRSHRGHSYRPSGSRVPQPRTSHL